MDPPPCVQNAMMTKDKKPFTYTPGGIDLSEVRSPRMARRIERNANLGGVGDIPKSQQPQPVNYGPLPPSTLAAMRPQPQVQVFPSGPPPPGPIKLGSGAPPPPPPMNMPPPPPPPSGPLPTQKVRTSDNQTLERPDMTKIIPDNPMALLRKTGGPAPRKSVVDEMFEQAGKGAPQPPTPPEQPRYQPPIVERVAATPSIPQHQTQPSRQQYSPEEVKEQPRYQDPPRYQPSIIERKPTIRQNNFEPEIKTSTAHLGSLYIPPANQQQSQKRVVTPPSPPERSPNNAGLQTPPLKEAPRPWQTKKPQQEELPPWTRRDNQGTYKEDVQNNAPTSSPPIQQQQKQSQRWPQSKPVQQIQPNQQYQYSKQPEYIDPPYQPPQKNYQQPSVNQQNQQEPIGLRIEIRTQPTPAYTDNSEERKPNAVYVTQPIVLQHPGPRPQQMVENQGARIVSEGSRQGSKTPSTPGNERSLNRQQSWGSNPTQSNSFKLIQKITQTEEDEDEDENIPITEHSPKFPSHFQQPADQMRRMKTEGDASMANRFKQVPSGPQTQYRQPHVRTIPIEIEDDEPPKKYVHPSEQVVTEPKKYTGSSIPSRSFKILQAMTAPPDNCANVDDQNEASLYDQWGYDVSHYHPHPYPPPPYWLDYYHNYYYPDPPEFSGDESTVNSTPISRVSTPTSYWGYASSYSKPKPKKISRVEETTPEKSNTNPRNTPLKSWNSYNYYTKNYTDDETTNDEYEVEEEAYSYFPPYYDPYYYHYYYGYPQMYPPYPYYGISEAEEFAGYYSLDDTNSSKKMCTKTNIKRRNSTGDITKKIVTPTICVKEYIQNPIKPGIETDISDSESESDDDTEKQQAANPLQSIKSVNNINKYNENEETLDHEILVEEYSDDTNEDTDEEQSFDEEAEAYPHQLSVILEESERTESRVRSVSVLSDSTTIADKSDVEDEEPQLATVQLPLKIRVNIMDENRKDIKKEILFEDGNIKTFETADTSMSFILTAPQLLEDSNKEVTIIEELISENKNSITNVDNTKNSESINTIDEVDDNGSTESEDWWDILGKDDDLPKPKVVYRKKSSASEGICLEKTSNIINDNNIEKVNNTDKIINDLEHENNLYETNNSATNLDIYANKHVTSSNENKHNTEVVTAIVPEVSGVVLRRKKKEVVVDLDLTTTYKRRSVYDLEDEEEENTEASGKILEMESFVEQFEEIKRNSGLWNFNLNNYENDTDINETDNTELKDKNSTEGNGLKQDEIDFWDTIKYEQKKLNEIVSNDYEKEIHSSTNYSKYNSSKSSLNNPTANISEVSSHVEAYIQKKDDSDSDESSESESSSSDDEEDIHPSKQNDNNKHNEETEIKLLTVQERIKALKESIKEKQNKLLEKENKLTVKEKIAALEQSNQNRSKTASSKSSLKSFEEISEEEEEVDSGVTSDMSRHISDSEEFPELKKLTKYQRAATHSRLFKLLQEQCDNEDEEQEKYIIEDNIDKFNKLSVRQNGSPRKLSPRRDLLNLPLNKYSESESISSSSGRNSPTSIVNEKLVSELIQSLLKCKKGQMFKNMPKEKLYAAAVKILQEDLDGMETPSDYSSFMSPIRSSTGSSTAAQTPQEFNSNFDEYKQYYQSWDEAESLHKDNNETLPSKALKLLQDSDLSKTGIISGLMSKCPRVITTKNMHRKIIKLLENSDCPSPTPDKPLDSKEVTTAS